jgi:hypothetical protein
MTAPTASAAAVSISSSQAPSSSSTTATTLPIQDILLLNNILTQVVGLSSDCVTNIITDIGNQGLIGGWRELDLDAIMNNDAFTALSIKQAKQLALLFDQNRHRL